MLKWEHFIDCTSQEEIKANITWLFVIREATDGEVKSKVWIISKTHLCSLLRFFSLVSALEYQCFCSSMSFYHLNQGITLFYSVSGCCNKVSQLEWLINTDINFYSSGDKKSEIRVPVWLSSIEDLLHFTLLSYSLLTKRAQRGSKLSLLWGLHPHDVI